MTKRRLVLMIGVCLTLVVGLGAWHANRPHPINRANFERIREGMTQAEVEAVFGYPPGDYATVDYHPQPFRMSLWGSKVWISNDGLIRIWFDVDRVSRATFEELPALDPSLLPGFFSRLRAWLGW